MSRSNAVWMALGLGACALALALMAAPPHGYAQGEGLRGVWTAEPSHWKSERAGTTTLVQLGLRRTGRRHGQWNTSFPVPLAELRGLSAAQMGAPRAEARFELVRDAGTLAFEGSFQGGDGAGHFTFAPNPQYVAALRGQGYRGLDDEKVFSLAVHDVSRAFIRELASLGYERLSLDQLLSLRIHGASPDFIRELRELGYAGLSVDQLVSLRIHGASPTFIRELKELGYTGVGVDGLVSLRIHGASPDFVRELKELGYASVAVDDLVSMRIHGVTPEFIRRVKGRSGRDLSVDRLVQMKIHGLDR